MLVEKIVVNKKDLFFKNFGVGLLFVNSPYPFGFESKENSSSRKGKEIGQAKIIRISTCTPSFGRTWRDK